MITEGQPAPDFELPDQNGKLHKLSDYRDQWVVLYFYPKDDTPGCTTEACQMRDTVPDFEQGRAKVLGISVDSVASHAKFANKFDLNFPILADVDKEVAQAYGVWGEKKFMGRNFMGINRTTFVISPDGRVAKVYEQVKPEGHATEVQRELTALQNY